MGWLRFLVLSALLIAAVAVTTYLAVSLAQKYTTGGGPPTDACIPAAVEAVYAVKLHGGPEVEAAVLEARGTFNGASDAEAGIFRSQLDENERAGAITAGEHEQLINAIAAYRFVRDEIRYNIGTVGIENAQDDLTTLRTRQGKCDEKSLLLISMFRYLNISARMEALSTQDAISVETCAQEGFCPCLARADHAVVAAELPAFRQLRTFADVPHYTNALYCSKDNYIFLDPTCIDCPFAYGSECTVSIPILNSLVNQTA